MKISLKIVFLHVLQVNAFRFPLINMPKDFGIKPYDFNHIRSHIQKLNPFSLQERKNQAEILQEYRQLKRNRLRANQKTKTSKSKHQNGRGFHSRRAKQLNAITAYFA